jgi:hypothetical protein
MKHYAKARVDRYNKRHHYYNKGNTEDLYELVEATINWQPVMTEDKANEVLKYRV